MENDLSKALNEVRRSEYKRLIESLFSPDKTFRDAVHGDITLTKLEILIVDTPAFQRLHNIRQLGTAHLIFSCANHTRFDHSIGCLFMAQKIIGFVNTNPYKVIKVAPYERLLIRLIALLHDLAHIPFGHTLEDEGNLFKSQWNDSKRVRHFLGSDSDVAKVIMSYELLEKLVDAGHTEYKPESLLRDLQSHLKAMEDKTIDKLKKPFICDIVGNTLCADLLDYIKRDIYFTGLREDYDERFLSYLFITEYKKKARLVLRLIKPRTNRLRRDVLSELLHLLRLRYSLAEKIYFHHAKISSSAMIISAVNSAMDEELIRLEDLYEMGDEVLFHKLHECTEKAKYLIGNLAARKLYKPVYALGYVEKSLERAGGTRRSNVLKDMRNPKLRATAEKSLEAMNGLRPGSVVIYCPSENMGLKAVSTLVELEDKKIGSLEHDAPDRTKIEIKSSITEKHQELWKMYVLVDSLLNNITRSNIHGDCTTMLGLTNDLENLNEYDDPHHVHYLMRWEERYNRENRKEKRIPEGEIFSMEEEVQRGGFSGKYEALSYDGYCRTRNAKIEKSSQLF